MYLNISKGLMCLAVAALVGCQVPATRTGLPVAHNLPPAAMLAEPGPGVGGPGPGVMNASIPPMVAMGAAAAQAGAMATTSTAQILFDRPDGMQVAWDVGGVGQFDSPPLVVPGRQNFGQGGVFRLKLTNIPGGGREGIELYPTLEVAPTTSRTAAYLAHSAIPIQFTDEDFDQVMAGNFVTKVIYVPDPEFQELALAGIDTLVSTRLDPGVNPVTEADRRGSILAVIRLGNKDLEMPGGADVNAGFMPASGGIAAAATSNYISGISGPNYGMPITGTNIGIPGPPHVPLGGPAGLQRYSIHNHTAHAIPGPTRKVNVHVKQDPGLTYPRPADKVLIREQTIRPPHFNSQPPADMVHGTVLCGACGGAGCGACR